MSSDKIEMVEAVGKLGLGTLAMLTVLFVVYDSVQTTREIRQQQLILEADANEIRKLHAEESAKFISALSVIAENQLRLLEAIDEELTRERLREEH